MSGTNARGDSWGPSRRLLAAGVASRFYERGQSKIDIADALGVSRFKIARLLEDAQERGLVRIEISAGEDLEPSLSESLREVYGLRLALVAPNAFSSGSTAQAAVAELAAKLLSEIVSAGDVLGLAWARTVNQMVDRLDDLAKCTVVQICGAYSLPRRYDNSVDTVVRAAAVCGGDVFPIYAPLVLPDVQTTAALRKQPGIVDAFDRFARLTTAVVAIGAWELDESTVYDVLTDEKRDALAEQGVVGEFAGLLFDADGQPLDTVLSHHVLAIDEETLRSVPEVIAVAGGAARAGAIDAVLRSGLVSTLVTDSQAADRLLRITADRPPRKAPRCGP